MNNIPDHVLKLVGRNLHLQSNHPVSLVKARIERFFKQNRQARPIGAQSYQIFDNFNPFVSTKANFDELLIPANHPSRSSSDTFYRSENTVLRTHTSAHQTELLRKGITSFLVFGDCYRKDTVDHSHYPVFHQVEGVLVTVSSQSKNTVEQHLKQTLEACMREVFDNDKLEFRWNSDSFPFTHPSWELEIFYQDKWLEVLGCGIIQPQILENCGLSKCTGWAFGIGLERLAMIKYNIPDIRLFWSEDKRFIDQFKDGETQFSPYSKHPPVYKDISMWIKADYEENMLHELAREVAGDLIECVELIDEFKHPKSGKLSRAYRITYRSMDRSLTNEEINTLQNNLREQIVARLNVDLR